MKVLLKKSPLHDNTSWYFQFCIPSHDSLLFFSAVSQISLPLYNDLHKILYNKIQNNNGNHPLNPNYPKINSYLSMQLLQH